MKTTRIILLEVVLALAAGQNLRAGQPAEVLQNRALANSPRMLELYPSLERVNVRSTPPGAGTRQLEAILKNRALANSPRIREQFPELTRSRQTPAGIFSRTSAPVSGLAEVTKNQALAESPRMKELFPELAL